MYTQCPSCHTVFAVTQTQLQARDGLVRCGKCAAVFHADEHLFDTVPKEMASPSRATKPQGLLSGYLRRTEDDEQIPTVTAFTPPQSRRRNGLWAMGALLALVTLAAQFAYYFRDYLAANQQLRPWVLQACEQLNCEIRPLQDPAQIELLEVEVAPHPEFSRALTLTAILVNRASFAQPLPLLELTLTDSRGTTVARRTFNPRDYVLDEDLLTQDMPPDVIVPARLDITQPEAAVGYEVQLVSSS